MFHSGNLTIHGYLNVDGRLHVKGNLTVNGNVTIAKTADFKVGGKRTIHGSLKEV